MVKFPIKSRREYIFFLLEVREMDEQEVEKSWSNRRWSRARGPWRDKGSNPVY